MQVTTVGLDLAKNIFQVHGTTADRTVVFNKSLEAAALTGLAPISHDSGAMRGKRAIGGGRMSLRHVMFQAALVASHHNLVLKTSADRLRAAGKPHKVVIMAVARKLTKSANALIKSRENGLLSPPERYNCWGFPRPSALAPTH